MHARCLGIGRLRHPRLFEPCPTTNCKGALSLPSHAAVLLRAVRISGAGKTFTMSGNSASYEQRGLIPRVLAALLSKLRCMPGLSSWSLSLSYLEVCLVLSVTFHPMSLVGSLLDAQVGFPTRQKHQYQYSRVAQCR